MSGTKLGGLKTVETNKRLHGKDFYSRIGKIGGAKGRGHTFAHGKVDPKIAGAKGGKISRKTKNVADINHKWYSNLKHILLK